MKNLNETELKVLKSVVKATDLQGGDYAWLTDVTTGLKVNQLKGYISQLSQKGFIDLDVECGMIYICSKSTEVIEGLEERVALY